MDICAAAVVDISVFDDVDVCAAGAAFIDSSGLDDVDICAAASFIDSSGEVYICAAALTDNSAVLVEEDCPGAVGEILGAFKERCVDCWGEAFVYICDSPEVGDIDTRNGSVDICGVLDNDNVGFFDKFVDICEA